MATFGDALAALEDFRTMLVFEQTNAPIPHAHALAFRAVAGGEREPAVRTVHATGVGIRKGLTRPKATDFVLKVYVFDEADVSKAAADALLGRPHQGVDVDVERLPVQVAFARKLPRRARATKPKAGTPAQHRQRVRPVPAGVEIGPLGGHFVGTLGCFVRRGPGDSGPLFVLSNNHVLADVNRFPLGTPHTQPFSGSPADVLAALSDFEPLRFPAAGSQPRNVIDAAIASVVNPAQVVLGRMCNISNYTPQLLAPRPGMAVTNAGRTTGVTVGTIQAIRVRGVQVNYGTRQQPIIATFDNAITILGEDGAPFSDPGDSGSVILDQASGRPVALLFAGDDRTTTACDIAAACTRFNVRPV
jgi:hypothetical protein